MAAEVDGPEQGEVDAQRSLHTRTGSSVSSCLKVKDHRKIGLKVLRNTQPAVVERHIQKPSAAHGEPGKAMLRTAMESLGLSARAHDRILRMARTIADLDGADNLQERHVSEAIGYRSLDRKLWAR